ncbi:hypothetical protein GCM10020369_27010 [Cryptosporangium minutisporangium]|uniref:Rv3660c-like CheY-like N-terminal domain-containing protein n=1 Tax=Cryptosporangium minutisporangium TaxID=113569 RepID=A0ABP6SX40_9ACTN
MSPPEARPLVCVRDPELADSLLRLGAAAGADVEVPVDPVGARPLWTEAPLVVVGIDVAPEYATARLPFRAGLVLAVDEQRTHPDDPIVWRLATELGAEHVVFLPTAEAWLVDRYTDAVSGSGAAGRVIAVVGGRGGAGASVLATALAVTAARQGSRAMLVDADPLGGGLDLLLGREDAAGLRWPDLVDTAGRMSPPALHDALPRVGELCVLSWDRGDVLTIPAEAAEAALEAGRRCSDVLVVDLPRRLDDAAVRALQAADLTLLVVPAEVYGRVQRRPVWHGPYERTVRASPAWCADRLRRACGRPIWRPRWSCPWPASCAPNPSWPARWSGATCRPPPVEGRSPSSAGASWPTWTPP